MQAAGHAWPGRGGGHGEGCCWASKTLHCRTCPLPLPATPLVAIALPPPTSPNSPGFPRNKVSKEAKVCFRRPTQPQNQSPREAASVTHSQPRGQEQRLPWEGLGFCFFMNQNESSMLLSHTGQPQTFLGRTNMCAKLRWVIGGWEETKADAGRTEL